MLQDRITSEIDALQSTVCCAKPAACCMCAESPVAVGNAKPAWMA